MSQTTRRWLTWAWYLMRIWAFSLYVLAWSDTRIAVKITNNAIKYYSAYVLGLLYLLEDSKYVLLMNNHSWWYIGCMLLPCLVEFSVTDKKLRRPRLYVTTSYTRRWLLFWIIWLMSTLCILGGMSWQHSTLDGLYVIQDSWWANTIFSL